MITVKEAKELATQLQGAEVEEAERLEKFIDDEIRKRMTPSTHYVRIKVGKVPPRVLFHLREKYAIDGGWYVDLESNDDWLFSISAPSQTGYRD